ncbi:odorant receptor 2a-like [Battus philenor]|uniref:odorant receptor 2a-like n=1 Tax=Battus philenor TaxID=42288 RepID=UPI0035D056D1
MGWKMYAVLCNLSYVFEIIVPLISHIVWGTSLNLPISNYHFLSDEIRDRYFYFWFTYQAFGMYGHMSYNINIDSFIAGLILCIILRVNILKSNLQNLDSKFTSVQKQLPFKKFSEDSKLKQHLRNYDIILRLSSKVQKIISVPAFVQFGVTTAIICVALCGLLTPSASNFHLFLVTYILSMTSRIFVPAWLGAKLTQQSQALVFAAYSSEWIERSENFKQNLRLFMTRACNPIIFYGIKICPVSLTTFTSIMKTAYSLFTLVRHIQNRQNGVI